MARDVSEHRKAAVVGAAKALREDRLEGGVALLVAAGFGLMISKASTREADGRIEAEVFDLVGPQRSVGQGMGLHTSGALLGAIRPLLEEAGVRPPKLRGIQGGRAIDKHRSVVALPLKDETGAVVGSVEGFADQNPHLAPAVPEDIGGRPTADLDLAFDGHRGMVRPEEP